MFTILLVEDQAVCRETLAKLLRYEGFEVITAVNGVEAVHALEQRTFDLVILDLVLPKLNGVALLDQIRHDDRWKDLPVIALTGSMDSWQIARISELSVHEIFSKMRFSVEDLLTSIRSSLADKQVTPTV